MTGYLTVSGEEMKGHLHGMNPAKSTHTSPPYL